MWERCEENKIQERLKKLAKEVQTKAEKISKRTRKSLQQIDKVLKKIMRKYERGGKTPLHIPWSPNIHRLNAKANFFKLWWRYCTKPTMRLKRKLEKRSTDTLEFDNNKPHVWVRQNSNDYGITRGKRKGD